MTSTGRTTRLPDGEFTAADRAVLASVDRYLSDALLLKRWFDRVDPTRAYAECFELQRTFNRPDTSYGFFDEVQLSFGRVPVMGSVQDMLYDWVRAPAGSEREVAAWTNRQVREFVLRYFMRVSDFRQPESGETQRVAAPPPCLARLSWCPSTDPPREGFGFTQLFYKLRETGEIGRFSEADASVIVDLRDLGRTYEWVVAKVRIFDFDVTFRPLGEGGPEIVFTLDEQSQLVLSPELITDRTDPEPGVLGEYAVGYAFIKAPPSGFLAYGPGRFDAAVEVIRFSVLASGQIRVHMVFVANRPTAVASVSLDPVDWALWTADRISGGAAAGLLRPLREALDERPIRLGAFDPVYTYVALANVLTGGYAADRLCIARDALDKQFLVQHFRQHYQTIVGSLLTWRQIPDWLDASALPEWVITGRSS